MVKDWIIAFVTSVTLLVAALVAILLVREMVIYIVTTGI